MRIAIAFILLGIAPWAHAQQNAEVVAELEPIVVSGNFQLQLTQPKSNHAVEVIERAIVEKDAEKEAHEQAGIFEAKFWRYIPVKLGLSDEKEFFAPSYSSVAYREAERELRASERNSLIAH